MSSTINFILVDNDPLNNMLNTILIRQLKGGAAITTFTDPEEALDYIETAYTWVNGKQTILLLDLIMPEMDGWGFIEKFRKFPERISDHFQTYILSSSIDDDDYKRASSIPMIKGYVEKPLKNEFLEELFTRRQVLN